MFKSIMGHFGTNTCMQSSIIIKLKALVIKPENQRTNGPVNAHLISWPSKAQHIQIIIKSLDPLRAKKTFIRKKLGHTMVLAIKASSVTL